MGTLKASEVGTAAQEMVAQSSWYEAKVLCEPHHLYECLKQHPEAAVAMFHHFYEPWHTKGPVVRLLIVDESRDETLALLNSWDAVVDVRLWEREQDDRTLFGEEFFPYAMMFFQGSSMLADHHYGDWMADKLVHCVLNARRMSRKQEFRFGLKFAWRSATIEPRLWWRALRTGKKWWEQ